MNPLKSRVEQKVCQGCWVFQTPVPGRSLRPVTRNLENEGCKLSKPLTRVAFVFRPLVEWARFQPYKYKKQGFVLSIQQPPGGREENLKYQVFFLWIHRTEVTHRAQLCKRGTLLFCQKINIHSPQPEFPNIGMRTFTSLCDFLIFSYLRVQSTRVSLQTAF